MEIEADRDARGGKSVDQHLFDECGRFQSRERVIELHHDGAVEAGRGEQAQLLGGIGQVEQRLARIEESARMRLEGQRRRRASERAGAPDGGCDHGAMAAVHALEIAHRHDRAGEPCRRRLIERVMNGNEA